MAIAPGTSVSNKGRLPMSNDSKEVQYLYAILQAINNLAGVTATATGTMQIQSTATGNTTITIPANSWLISIAALANNHNETINIGTTPAGSDITSSFPVVTSGYTSFNVNRYFATSQIIYITGATGSVTYQVLTSLK